MPIRVLTAKNAPAYFALRLRMLSEEPRAFGSDAESFARRTLEDVAGRLAPTPERFTLGAFEDDALVGTVVLGRETALKTRHKAGVYGVYVAPEARGRGHAGELLSQLLLRAGRMPGLEVLMLAVAEPQVAARALYQQAGFKVFGTEPDALRVNGEPVTELHLRLELRWLELDRSRERAWNS